MKRAHISFEKLYANSATNKIQISTQCRKITIRAGSIYFPLLDIAEKLGSWIDLEYLNPVIEGIPLQLGIKGFIPDDTFADGNIAIYGGAIAITAINPFNNQTTQVEWKRDAQEITFEAHEGYKLQETLKGTLNYFTDGTIKSLDTVPYLHIIRYFED